MPYAIPDVTGQIIGEVAKILANSPTPLSKAEINACFLKPLSQPYLDGALSVCSQFGLCEEKQGGFIGAEKFRDELKRASRDQLFVVFEACLKDYPPFLLYVDFASKNYSSKDAAARARGILKIRGSSENVENSLRRWGLYAGLIEYDKEKDAVKVKVKVEKLTTEYIARLLRAFEADLTTKLLIIDMLGAETFAFLDQKDIKLDELASALLTFENDPDSATGKSTKVLESFLWKIGEDAKLPVSSTKGLMQLTNLLRSSSPPVILLNHTHILHGMGAIRNMTHHAQDSETGSRWKITKQTSLLTSLFIPSIIRSLHLYNTEKKQEL